MANANRGLGKGLGALLGDAALRTDTSDNLYLPISQIEPYANQPATIRSSRASAAGAPRASPVLPRCPPSSWKPTTAR